MEHHTGSKISPWHSLRTRATVFTLAVFVVGIWAIATYATRLLQTDMERMLGQQQFQAASGVAIQVNTELQHRQEWLVKVASQIDRQLLANPQALQTYLEQRMVALQMFNGGVWIAGLDGTAIADVPVSAQRLGVNYLSVGFIAAVLKEGMPIISAPILGKKRLTPVVAIAVPIRDTQGRVIGVISGVTDLGKPNFLDKIAQGQYGKTGGYLLVAPQHQLIVTASDKSRIMQTLPAPGINTMHDRYMQGYEGFGMAVSSRGLEEISAAKGIPVAGWFLAVVMPTAEAFAPVYAMQQRLLWATALLTLLAGVLIWWILTRWTQSEAALLDSQQNLSITLNSIGDAVIATDVVGRITHMNPVAERLTGWPLAEALGQMLTEVFHIVNVSTRQLVTDPVQLVIDRGEVVGLANHSVLIAQDGSEYQIDDSAAPIRNAAGDIVGVVLVFSDVKLTPFRGHFLTERKSPICPDQNHPTRPPFALKW